MNDAEYLGIEGGGTRTVAVVVAGDGAVLRRATFGPGNARLLGAKGLQKLFAAVKAFCPAPAAIGGGLAGVRDEKDRETVQRAIAKIWKSTPAIVTHDLEIALAAAGNAPAIDAKVLVLSGTGSCCYGRNARRVAKVGGWGHLLGDIGSGYAIAHEALRMVVYEFDRHQKWTALGKRFMEALLLNDPDDLIAWIQNASKADVAALARHVLELRTDPIARRVADQAAESLARDAILCARRLGTKSILFVLAGGLLLKQPAFANRVRALIRKSWAAAEVIALKNEGAWGAAEIARKAATDQRVARKQRPARDQPWYVPEFVPENSPTEQRNRMSMRFHELSTAQMVKVMLDAEKDVIPALLKERGSIIRAIDMAAETLKRGGRIFYIGAGTSGRLGVLDASECPPTFRASPEMIQGIIAGGQRALWEAVEGAEDDAAAGASALRFRKVQPRDLVIGIAASGRTPFVWGALGVAKSIGAKTVLLCFNPSLEIERAHRPDLVLAPNLGPEILTGSTRLKSGTATKLILNMVSTIAMVRLGKVISNLMVDLSPSNIKLRDRAVRILQELTQCDAAEVRAALHESGWVVKEAWTKLWKRRR